MVSANKHETYFSENYLQSRLKDWKECWVDLCFIYFWW